MGSLVTQEYRDWLKELKLRFRQTQIKASVSVNSALLEFYWSLGAEIVEKQKDASWGDGFLKQLAEDLSAEFPEISGFSYRNIRAVKQWFLFWSGDSANWQQPVARLSESAALQTGQQPVARITRIPWGHNLVIIGKCESHEEALFYVRKTP